MAVSMHSAELVGVLLEGLAYGRLYRYSIRITLNSQSPLLFDFSLTFYRMPLDYVYPCSTDTSTLLPPMGYRPFQLRTSMGTHHSGRCSQPEN